MGLWREVYLTSSGPVSVRNPQVLTKLDVPSLSSAELTVSAALHNAGTNPVKGTCAGRLITASLRSTRGTGGWGNKVVTFDPESSRN